MICLLENGTELLRSDPLNYPSLEGKWKLLNTSGQDSLQPFNLFCACKHSQITGDLIYRVYEDGTANTFIMKKAVLIAINLQMYS